MKRDYANELDLLRFLAALAVTFFHVLPRCIESYGPLSISFPPLISIAKYAYMGVDLFFMISGFVVIGSAQSGSLRSFISGRITRLYPAFWFCCTFTFLAILAAGNEPYLTFDAYLANMTMYPSMFGAHYLDIPYWTLAVELRFYALIGCLILIGQIRNAERWMAGWLIATILIAIFSVSALRYHLLVDYSAYFIAGATFHFIRVKGITPLRLAVIIACMLLSMDHAVTSVIQNPIETPQYANRDPIVACAVTFIFFIVFFAIASRHTGRFGNLRWYMLGVLTYPLYLLHQTIGMLIITKLKPDLGAYLVFWGTVIVSLLAAYLVHKYVEVPFASRLRALLAGRDKRPAVVLPVE